MKECQRDLISQIRDLLPFDIDTTENLGEQSILADLGITSLHLISLLMKLKDRYCLDIDQLAETGMPITIGDLVALLPHDVKPT